MSGWNSLPKKVATIDKPTLIACRAQSVLSLFFQASGYVLKDTLGLKCSSVLITDEDIHFCVKYYNPCVF